MSFARSRNTVCFSEQIISTDIYPSIFILKDIAIFFLQVSLQAIALGKINETSALLVSSLRQGNWDRVTSDFLGVLMHCSPTNLDAAISLGEELINLFLQNLIDNQTQPELFCCIGHITRNFQTRSLLHEAARRGSVEQLKRLLQNRRGCVDVQRFFSERDERGKTPLMWACLNNSVDVIKFLLSNGVDLYARDSSGQTPFLHACRGNTREVLDFLARRGARIHDIDNDGQHGVHHAARCNTREVLELLCQKLQADIHLKDWKNRFPIHHAAATGRTENVLFLLQNRSCLNSKTRVIRDRGFDELGNNYGGMTPVLYAAQNGYAKIVRLLEQHGADIDAVTDCGRSVLMLAAENGHKDVLVYCTNESSLSASKEKHVVLLSKSPEIV